ncbi:mechanosensitive ion channel domain-containing protein [Kitasatospora aureofaciens]|uniref:mechanosensitive ion channel family protein n=1 Tax=Kitasatospora aureofaciens TaxID=1894 RepID=UPI00099750B0|nr:mechanosensitive ion channel domain-containing protein [Kitasatospora aureofaciens]HJD84672.1 mechanosensitive ion channel family protein [Kitasatospora aureofaciens]
MWWSLLRLAVAGVATALFTYGLDRAVQVLARRLTAPRGTAGVPEVLRKCRRPVLALTGCLLLSAAQPWINAPSEAREGLRHLAVILAISSGGWLCGRLVAILVDGATRLAVYRREPAWAGRARTQASLLGRICQAVVAVVTLGAVLMTFPAVRGIGTSLLASAGLVGVVAGVAAQSTLANVFAGVQMAFGDLARIGDVVVVAGEWGTVEEITLTAVVIATWDQRRLIMPMSYFVGRPFENWSRRSSRITGTALLHLDHHAPVGLLRQEFDDYLAKSELWDGQGSALQVVDTTPTTIVVRVLATAANGSDAFELRCRLREHLIDYLREEHPYALPRIPVAEAPVRRPDCPEAPRASHAPHSPRPPSQGRRGQDAR